MGQVRVKQPQISCGDNFNEYPTGQNYSSELMFAKFATAKNHEKLNPLIFSSSGAISCKQHC